MSSRSHRVPSAARWRLTLGLLAVMSVPAATVLPGSATANSAPSAKTPPAGAPAHSGGGTPPPAITAAVARLEQSGVIDQSQEQIIDQQLASPDFSIVGLVNGGTITGAQEQQLLSALQQAKQSLAQPSHGQLRTAHKSQRRTSHSRRNRRR